MYAIGIIIAASAMINTATAMINTAHSCHRYWPAFVSDVSGVSTIMTHLVEAANDRVQRAGASDFPFHHRQARPLRCNPWFCFDYAFDLPL